MRNIMIIVAIVSLLFAGMAMANDEETTVGQVMLTGSHSFWQKDKVSGFAFASAFYNANNHYMAVFLYGGAQANLTDRLSVYLLGVTFNDAAGMSAGPSVWGEYVFGKDNKNCLFAEADYYIPWRKADPELPGQPHQYYGYADYTRSLPDDVKIGVAFETMGSIYDEEPFELQYGPFVQFDNFRFWGFYNETPGIDGNQVGVRAKWSL